MKHFDVFVIGAGSGNIVSRAALDAGLSVGLCEKYKFGGTCLTRGCIPTKILATAADKICDIHKLKDIGVQVDSQDIHIDQELIKERVFSKIDNCKSIPESLRRAGAEVYAGVAHFKNDNILEITCHDDPEHPIEVTADTIVISSGAKTRIPEIEGLEEVSYLTSETFFDEGYPQPFPRSIIMVGGGYIGCEFASIFSAFGCEVHIIQSAPRLLRPMDEELSAELTRQFRERGIKVSVESHAKSVRIQDGKKYLTYTEGGRRDQSQPGAKQSNTSVSDTSQDGHTTQETHTAQDAHTMQDVYTAREAHTAQDTLFKEICADEIFIAPGVVPNSAELGLENTSLRLDSRGYVVTNEAMETSVPHIYCIGDANGQIQLRHKANKEARILAHNLFGTQGNESTSPANDALYQRMDYSFIPAVVFSTPELASVGMTEQEAVHVYGKDSIGIRSLSYAEVAKGFALGYKADNPQEGFVKIIVNKDTDKILGVHILGEQAALLMQTYSYLLNLSPHEVPAVNEMLRAREKLKAARQVMPMSVELDPGDVHTINQLVTTHPALGEVAAWAARQKDREPKDS